MYKNMAKRDMIKIMKYKYPIRDKNDEKNIPILDKIGHDQSNHVTVVPKYTTLKGYKRHLR